MLFPSQQETMSCNLISYQISTFPDCLHIIFLRERESTFYISPLSLWSLPFCSLTYTFLVSLLFYFPCSTLLGICSYNTEAAGGCFPQAKKCAKKNSSTATGREKCKSALKGEGWLYLSRNMCCLFFSSPSYAVNNPYTMFICQCGQALSHVLSSSILAALTGNNSPGFQAHFLSQTYLVMTRTRSRFFCNQAAALPLSSSSSPLLEIAIGYRSCSGHGQNQQWTGLTESES